MRKSLERPAVRQYLLAQRVVLRSCLSAKNLLRLDALADQKTNLNAAVKASQIIEAVSDEALTARPMASFDPHVTIGIIAESPEPPNATIDIIPAPFASQRLPEPEPPAREPTLWDCSAAAGDRRPEPPYPMRTIVGLCRRSRAFTRLSWPRAARGKRLGSNAGRKRSDRWPRPQPRADSPMCLARRGGVGAVGKQTHQRPPLCHGGPSCAARWQWPRCKSAASFTRLEDETSR